MNTEERLHLERAISFLSKKPCTTLELLQLKLCLDAGASEPPIYCYLVLKPLAGVGDVDIVFPLQQPASKSMIERVVKEVGNALKPEDDEYAYYFGAALMKVWLHDPIVITLPDAKDFASRLDLGSFCSVSALAAVEFQVMAHCARAGYQSVFNDILPLGSLVEQSILEEACGLASGTLIPRREFT